MAVSIPNVQDESTEILDSIRTRIRIERRQVTDERQALETFAERVQSVSLDETHHQSAPVLTKQSTTGFAEVRDAYQSTVMCVPHYENEYGDTYAESVLEEFGPTVGVTLVKGKQFTEPCRNTLLVAVDQALTERSQLLDAIEGERESIAEVRNILEPVIADLASFDSVAFEDEDFGSLDAYRARLAALSKRCDEAAAVRQTIIRDQRRELQLPTDELDLPTYLYRECESDYPVLALIARLGSEIETMRGNIATVIANRA